LTASIRRNTWLTLDRSFGTNIDCLVLWFVPGIGRNRAIASRNVVISSGGLGVGGAGLKVNRRVMPYTISAGARPTSDLTVLRKASKTNGSLVLQCVDSCVVSASLSVLCSCSTYRSPGGGMGRYVRAVSRTFLTVPGTDRP